MFAARVVAALAAGLPSLSASAHAWTRPGHMVTAAIAYDDLAPSDAHVIERIGALLAQHPDRGAFEVAAGRAVGAERVRRLILECARWPDDARGTVFDHPSWHAALSPHVRREDPPPRAPAAAILGDAVEAFALNARVAANEWPATLSDRAAALCWVMHVAGDIHQPLHTAQLFSARRPDGDRAGSLQFVRDPQSGEPVSLHWFWDDAVHRQGEPETVYARAGALVRRYPRTSLAPRSARVRDFPVWREESLRLAPMAFAIDAADSPESARPPSEQYLRWSSETAERRVTLAGYRLADVLREIFSADAEGAADGR